MQYLGSERGAVAFSFGMAVGIFAAHFLLGEIDDEVLPDASIAALTVFVGTLVGILVWSRAGQRLKRREAPSHAVCVGIGVCFALALTGVIAVTVHSIQIFPPDNWVVGVLHDIVFWLALSLWNSVGFGLAVSPSPSRETAFTTKG